MELALLELLQCSGNEDEGLFQCKKRALSKAFEIALLNAVSNGSSDVTGTEVQNACVRQAVETFFSAPTPEALETFLVQVVAMIHCYTVLSPLEDSKALQLPKGVKAAAVALSTALFSQSLCAACMEVKTSNCVELLDHPLWFCFLCVFLQQLSARGGDFIPWQQFFRECATQHGVFTTAKTAQGMKTMNEAEAGNATTTHDDGIDNNNIGDNDDSNARSEQLGIAAWGAISEETFNATIARSRFRRTAILCKSFCPHLVAQAPGTTYQLLHTFHTFMLAWRDLQQNGTPDKKDEVAVVMQYSEQLGRLLGDGQVHAFLLATVIGAVLSSTYILSKRGARSGEPVRWCPPPLQNASVEGEAQWRSEHFPPIGRLLERLHIRPLLDIHLFTLCMQLRIGLSPTHHTDGRQKLALSLYLMEVCPLRIALAIYHFSSTSYPPGPLEISSAALPGEALALLSKELDRYVHLAHSELVFSAVDTSTMRWRPRYNSSSSEAGATITSGSDKNDDNNEPMPKNGELVGSRFVKMVFPVPCPTWNHYLEGGKSTAVMENKPSSGVVGSSGKQVAALQHVTPCQFVLDLLVMGLPCLAAEAITELQVSMGVNVCLVPAVAMPSCGGVCTVNKSESGNGISIASSVMQRVYAILNATFNDEKVDDYPIRNEEQRISPSIKSLRALEAYFPLLSTIYAYVGSQTFLCDLLDGLRRECDIFLQSVKRQRLEGNMIDDDDSNSNNNNINRGKGNDIEGLAAICRDALGMAELYLIRVIMPCMRVIAPSPILYDRVQALLTLLREGSMVVNFGTNSAEFLHTEVWLFWLLHPSSSISAPSSAPLSVRAPHDALRSKELEALFAQSLKRMTQANVGRYRNTLRPVIYANPLLVAEKLFQQAVGYSNNFLHIHTQLLKGAPVAVMTLVAHEGLLNMRRYAEQERLGAMEPNRVGLIATFLAVLWRDNPRTFDGGILLRAAEYSLRREARACIVFGVELLKAILHELLDITLEHEEQYSVAQIKALITPSSTQWFTKGAAESFRRGRWDACFTPVVLANAASILRSALQEPCTIPLEQEEKEVEEEEEEVEVEVGEVNIAPVSVMVDGEQKEVGDDADSSSLKLTLGQCILLHLCRLHSNIYAVQADLAGTVQLVLLTTAQDYNVINDLLLSVEALLPLGPPVEEIYRVAMPHVALRLTARFAAKEVVQRALSSGEQQVLGVDALFTVTPSEVNKCVGNSVPSVCVDSVIPTALMQKLSCYTAAHFVFDEYVYTMATKEINEFFNCVTAILKENKNNSASNSNGGESSSFSRNPTVLWLREKTQMVKLEKEAHRKLYQECKGSWATLFDELRSSGALSQPVAFATSYLLPRALLSLEDTLFVYHFLKWLLNITRPSSGLNGDYERVVDVILSLVSCSMTFFAGFTDGECKRLGFLLSLLLPVLQVSTEKMPLLPPGSTAEAEASKVSSFSLVKNSSALPLPANLSTEALMAYLEPKPRSLLTILAARFVPEAIVKSEEENTSDPNSKVDAPVEEATTEKWREKYEATPAYPLQLEAYLCRALVQLLMHQCDVPFLQRNAFLVLERLVKNAPDFPSTLCCTEWLISAVTPHAVRSSSLYASATAVLKVLRDNQKEKRGALQKSMPSLAITNVFYWKQEMKLVRQAKVWQQWWRTRESYIRFLLAEDMVVFDKKNSGSSNEEVLRVANNDNEDDDDDDDEDEEVTMANVNVAESDEGDESETSDAENTPQSHSTNEEGVDEETTSISSHCNSNQRKRIRSVQPPLHVVTRRSRNEMETNEKEDGERNSSNSSDTLPSTVTRVDN